MKNACKTLIIAAALSTCVYACGGGEQPTVAPVSRPKASVVDKPVEDVPKAADEVQKSEAALKNPFQSYIIAKMLDSENDVIVKGPLECCELTTFTVVAALVMQGDKPYALIKGGIEGDKRFIVHLGDKIGVNGGRVVDIETSGITVREIFKDLDGNVVNTNNVKLSISEGKDDASKPGAARGGGRPMPRR